MAEDLFLAANRRFSTMVLTPVGTLQSDLSLVWLDPPIQETW